MRRLHYAYNRESNMVIRFEEGLKTQPCGVENQGLRDNSVLQYVWPDVLHIVAYWHCHISVARKGVGISPVAPRSGSAFLVDCPHRVLALSKRLITYSVYGVLLYYKHYPRHKTQKLVEKKAKFSYANDREQKDNTSASGTPPKLVNGKLRF